MTERRIARLTRDEIAARAPDALAVLPIGATEQHGPHLATGTDHLVVGAVAEMAAAAAGERRSDVLVAPTIPFGFSAHHHAFGATISISTSTLLAFVREACESLVASGFRHVFVLNGHGGNDELVTVAARQVGTDTGAVVAAGSYWVIAWDALVAAGAQDVGRLPGHAGAFETSLLAALVPDAAARSLPARPAPYAARERYHPDFHVEDRGVWLASEGFSDDPSAADPAFGERAATAVVSAVADAFVAVHRVIAQSAAPSAQRHDRS